MPDIREKPKFDKPKTFDRGARLPREAGQQLREKYIQQLKRGEAATETEPESAGEYAVNRVEAMADRGLNKLEDAAHSGIDRFRRQKAKAGAEAKYGQYAEAGGFEPSASGPAHSPGPPEPIMRKYGQGPHAEHYTGQAHPQARAYSDGIPEPQRRLWKERAVQKRQEVLKERNRIIPRSGPDEPFPTGRKNAALIETHFDIKGRRRARTIRECAAGSTRPAKGQSVIKGAAGSAPKVRGHTATVSRRAAKQAEKQVRQRATKQAAKQMGKAAIRVVKAVASSIAKGVSAIIAAGGGGVLIVLLLFIGAIAAIAASPFGLFFAAEQNGPGTVPVAEAVAMVNMDYNANLEALQSGGYDGIVMHGQATSWPEVLAVFASKTAGADSGADVATLDAERIALLKSVFWDMTAITSEVETIDHSDSDPHDEVDDSWTEYILHITITAKTVEEMRAFYRFTDYQNDALTELLAEYTTLSSLVGDLTITNINARTLLAGLPEDLSDERREVVTTACTLVGKVNYFWGGKSLVIGWDSRWGQLSKVWADGSSTTGTWRPYGLDCSGYVDWVFNNSLEYVIGHGGGAADQYSYCDAISWSSAQPGDLVFYPDSEHVGIVVKNDDFGTLTVVHCASGYNNVVITQHTEGNGFAFAGRPQVYL